LRLVVRLLVLRLEVADFRAPPFSAAVAVEPSPAALAALSRFISRDLRRATLFGWRTPFEEARSSAETAVVASCAACSAASPRSPSARRKRVILVLTADFSERLRTARAALRRASFLEEAMLAMSHHPGESEHGALDYRRTPPGGAAGPEQARLDPSADLGY
jgi:hypothetical protein